MSKTLNRPWLASLLLAIAFTGAVQAQLPVRAGYFPNITHPQALVGKAQGAFERSLGPGYRIEWKQFNAGPSVIEAIFAGALDLSYIGPSPALNGYIQSHGEALRVVAGACSGGAARLAALPGIGNCRQGRRRAGSSARQSRPAYPVSQRRDRRRLGAGTLGHASYRRRAWAAFP